MARGEASLSLATARVWRPAAFAGDLEATAASPGLRQFPVRVAGTFGICLKRGPAHAVIADGVAHTYPADAVCVRQAGCVWSSGPSEAGFIALDLAPRLLPPGLAPAPMRFVARARLPGVAGLVARIAAPEHAVPDLAREEALLTLIRLLARAGVLDGVQRGEAAALSRRAVARACERLAADLVAPPALAELAGEVGVGRFALLRGFRRELGTTPHAYLVRLRVERARELLARGMPAAQAALAAGFADQAHLTRFFTRVVGLTPAAYARRTCGWRPSIACKTPLAARIGTVMEDRRAP